MQVNLDLASMKKTYTAALAGAVSLVLGYFNVVDDTLAWRISEILIFGAIAFDRMGTAKVDEKLNVVKDLLGQIVSPPDAEVK